MLITFYIITYNHENFISDAIEGALSQTYSPLEIIISDDCSTDRTWDIILQKTSNYLGPHKIILLRNSKNMGIASHINNIWQHATGEWIVASAGDDVSINNRVNEVAKVILTYPQVNLISSEFNTIDDNSVEHNKYHNSVTPGSEEETIVEITDINDLINNRAYFRHGATLSYSKNLIQEFPQMHTETIYEDTLYSFRSLIVGKTAHIKKILVQYRVHSNQTTNVYVNDPNLSRSKMVKLWYGAYIVCKQQLKDYERVMYKSRRFYFTLIYNLFLHKIRLTSLNQAWPFRLIPFFLGVLIGAYRRSSRRSIMMIILPASLGHYIFNKKNKYLDIS